jgi:hypothetical protein
MLFESFSYLPFGNVIGIPLVLLLSVLAGWGLAMFFEFGIDDIKRWYARQNAEYSPPARPRSVTRDVRFIGTRKEYPNPTQSGAELVALRRQKRG